MQVRLTWVLPLLFTSSVATAQSEVASKVFLNGVPTPVYFNDGDSFLVLSGKHRQTRARLAGFNTLESYGPVHQWGDWKAKELFWIAKLATLNARQGVWHCESKDMKTDTYGRILWFCPDLAEDQIRRGLAHAMTISEQPAETQYLAAQADAVRNKRGMWAHGVPAYVMTSIHSITEGRAKNGKVYDRLVSSWDGHSASRRHAEAYAECQNVCSMEREIDESTVKPAMEALTSNADLNEALKEMSPARIEQLVRDYGQLGYTIGLKAPHKENVEGALLKLTSTGTASEGVLKVTEPKKASCVIYAEFERRYGDGRAECMY